MQHGERERELMIQLSAALRETERLQEALGDAFEDGRAADRRAEAAESALAAARRECEGLRKALKKIHEGSKRSGFEWGEATEIARDALAAPGDSK